LEISKSALLKLVRAARMSLRLADDMKKLTENGNGLTVADNISGELNDALSLIVGERLSPEQDYLKDSFVLRFLKSNMGDGQVMQAFCAAIAWDEARGAEGEEVRQPAPVITERRRMRQMVRENGGYLHETPEGEWK
jgi:hypothetical protein